MYTADSSAHDGEVGPREVEGGPLPSRRCTFTRGIGSCLDACIGVSLQTLHSWQCDVRSCTQVAAPRCECQRPSALQSRLGSHWEPCPLAKVTTVSRRSNDTSYSCDSTRMTKRAYSNSDDSTYLKTEHAALASALPFALTVTSFQLERARKRKHTP